MEKKISGEEGVTRDLGRRGRECEEGVMQE
jgi:hypothetical protein